MHVLKIHIASACGAGGDYQEHNRYGGNLIPFDPIMAVKERPALLEAVERTLSLPPAGATGDRDLSRVSTPVALLFTAIHFKIILPLP